MQRSLKQPRVPIKHESLLQWLTGDSKASQTRRKAILGYFFVLPTLLGLLVFTVGPVAFSFGLSFFDWNVIDPARFVGLDNYSRILNDSVILVSLRNTIFFVVVYVSLQTVIALMLALALQQKRMRTWMRYVFRSVLFLPLLTSGVTISIVLTYMFQSELGPINYYLSQLGLPRIPWLTSSQWSLITVILTALWQGTGFSLIIYLGGLGGISRELLDAAEVDGAYGFRLMWNIIVPLLSPTLLFTTVTGVIGALQLFDQPFIMSRGGPGDSSRTIVMNIYQASFGNLELGYGSAISVILFGLILIVTAAQFYVSKRWVFYQ